MTLGLAGAVVAIGLLRDDLVPSECRFCDGSSPGEVNAIDAWFRDALARRDTTPAKTTSDVLAYGASPVSALGLDVLAAAADRRTDEVPVNALVIAEGSLAGVLVVDLLSPLTARPRPDVHAIADEDQRTAALAEPGSLASFPSGHVGAAFAMAAAGGTVASMRGYRLAPLVWAAGIMLGAATAYTRMAADRAYFTDTLAGAAVGTIVGGGVPLLFHGPQSKARTALPRWLHGATIASSAVPGGRVIGLAGSF